MEFESSDLCREFSDMLLDLCKLLNQKNYKESLKLIDNFYSKNAERDRSNQLRYECDRWLALVLEKAGYYNESLQILRRLYKNIKPEDEMFISNRTDIVRTLIKMRRFGDGILESEITLDKQVNGDGIDLLTLLFYYVQGLQLCSQELPDKYFNLTTAIIKKLSPQLLNLNLIDSENLCKAILETYEQHNAANKRYSRLVISLDETESDSHRISLLKNYIKNEDFAFYRELALEELHELEERR